MVLDIALLDTQQYKVRVLYSRDQLYKTYTCMQNTTTQWRRAAQSFRKIYPSLYLKGLCVRGSWRPNKTAIYWHPHWRTLMLKNLKMVLNTSLLNTQQYKVRIKGKVEQPWERSSALPYTCVVTIEKEAFWSPSTTVGNFTFILFNTIYSFICTQSNGSKYCYVIPRINSKHTVKGVSSIAIQH